MAAKLKRREFLGATVAGGALCLTVPRIIAAGAAASGRPLISPGCRRSKVRVGKLYLTSDRTLWPTPKLDPRAEADRYEAEIARMQQRELADVEFVANEIIASPADLDRVKDQLADVDGILAIHLGMGITETLKQILALDRPTVVFAAPYSGHEWSGWGALRRRPEGAKLECLLTSDVNEIAEGIRPIRAIHHMREAKILNVTARKLPEDYIKNVREKLGPEIKVIDRETVLAAYEAVPEDAARAEADRWIGAAEKVVEPPKDEIVRSCRLALAFENMLAEEDATVITVDCYGTMYRQLPAFPCIGFTRLNNMGLGGICESDLSSALTHILFQGLAGRPGFISDPTMDVSRNSIILAHCLGSTKMEGPDGPAAPYRIRTIMERQEGAVTQVMMPTGKRVTQAIFAGTDLLLYFTGEVIEAPDTDRGCRTKITVKVDGDADKLWENWSHGLHRSTCYGDITKDLTRFCRLKGIRMVNEAEQYPEV